MIATTTIDALEAGLRTVIAGIVPTLEWYADQRWSHANEGRALVGSSVIREYRIDWRSPGVVLGGLTGGANTEVQIGCNLITAYRGIRPEMREVLANYDAIDLYDAFSDHVDGSPDGVAGLVTVDFVQTSIVNEATGELAHEFVLSFMRAR